MSHKFDFKNKAKLDSKQRKKLLPAKKLLLEFGLKPKDTFVDFGAGTGYFTFTAAKIVGKNGAVYALDISEKMLDEIKIKIEKLKTFHVKIIKVSEIDKNSLVIEDNFANFVLASQVLHEVDNLYKTLQEIYRILKPLGILGIIEWNKSEQAKECPNHSGPPIHHRINLNYLLELLKKVGFNIDNYRVLNDYFYIIKAIKR